MWLHSVVLNQGKKTIFNEYNDPFKFFKNIIAVTQEVSTQLEDGSISRFAIFGIHLETTIFR